MNKYLVFLTIAIASTITLTACSNSSGGSNSPKTYEEAVKKEQAKYPTFTEDEMKADLTGVNAKEKALSDAGFKFKTDYTEQNGMETTTYKIDIDQDVMVKNLTTANGKLDTKKASSLLSDYSTAAAAYLKKYSGTFNISKNGEVTSYSLKSSTTEELTAKVDLANKLKVKVDAMTESQASN